MKYLSVLLLLLTTISCKKSEIKQLPEFPATLYLNRISVKSKIRLYTDKREITDKTVIDRFVKSYGGFTLKDSSFVSDLYIRFFSPDSAEFSDTFNSLLVTKNDKQLVFKSTRKLIVSEEDIQNFYNMAKYRSEFERMWGSQFSHYNMFVGYGNYSELNLSLFEYNRVWWNTHGDPNYYLDPHRRGRASGTWFNEFDESYVNSLSKADTLAFREYFYSFKKR